MRRHMLAKYQKGMEFALPACYYGLVCNAQINGYVIEQEVKGNEVVVWAVKYDYYPAMPWLVEAPFS